MLIRHCIRAITVVILSVLPACAWVGCAAHDVGPGRVLDAPAPLVAVVTGEDVDTMVEEALARTGGIRSLIRDGDRVVIKPNLTWIREEGYTPGITTDLRIVRALVKQIRQSVPCELIIAEGTPASAARMFDALGYAAVAREFDVELIDVDRSPRKTVRIDGVAHDEYNLPTVTQDADVLIDVAVLKTHDKAGVTLGMKNLYGLLDNPKSRFHGQVHEVICDLSIAREPDFVIIDGIVGMEGQGPIDGEPIRRNLLVAGRNVVAVDAVGTALMGFDPKAVKHLRLAHQRGLGEIDPARIGIVGVPLSEARHEFRPAMRDAKVTLEATPARMARLQKLGDHVEQPRWGRGLFVRFEPGTLAVNDARYPQRKPTGFSAYVHRRREIHFRVPYMSLYPEHQTAAEEELRRWIDEQLDADAAE